MRCRTLKASYSAAAPATVMGEPTAEHATGNLHGVTRKAAGGDDPRARRPAVARPIDSRIRPVGR